MMLMGQLSPTLFSNGEHGSETRPVKLPAIVGRQELLQSQPASRQTLPRQFSPCC